MAILQATAVNLASSSVCWQKQAVSSKNGNMKGVVVIILRPADGISLRGHALISTRGASGLAPTNSFPDRGTH